MAFEKELRLTQRIAREAGDIILSHYHSDFQIELKSDASPVTIADKASSEYILAALAEAFPQDAAFSEESNLPDHLLEAQRVWVIDPMDGTQEFINKNGEFAVMIGLVIKQEPVLGIVYQPVNDILYYAVTGQGAFCEKNGQITKLQISDQINFSELRIAASRSHMSQELIDFYHELELTHIIQQGSVGLKLALIAQASCELYMNVSGITSCWDTCAPQVILKEAGGEVTNLSGTPLRYDFKELKNSNGIVASNKHLHQQILQKIQVQLENHYRNELEELNAT